MTYVVVLNRETPGPALRHIVRTEKPYDKESFQGWYYNWYFKLDGDEFIYCPTRKDVDDALEAAKQEET